MKLSRQWLVRTFVSACAIVTLAAPAPVSALRPPERAEAGAEELATKLHTPPLVPVISRSVAEAKKARTFDEVLGQLVAAMPAGPAARGATVAQVVDAIVRVTEEFDSEDPGSWAAEHAARAGEDDRVRALLARLRARGVRINGEAEVVIVATARLHDLGKLLVSGAILNKPAPLTGAERAIIARHPSDGAGLLGALTEDCAFSPQVTRVLSQVAAGVLSHHERWDGTGYPRRISELDIPLAGRVITVLDAYDAMISDRPYRRAMAPAAVIAELQRGRNTQFDPQVVDAFLEVLEVLPARSRPLAVVRQRVAAGAEELARLPRPASASTAPIRVLIVARSDRGAWRQLSPTFKFLLATKWRPESMEVASVDSFLEAHGELQAGPDRRPDIVLIDAEVEGPDGGHAAERLIRDDILEPNARVLVALMHKQALGPAAETLLDEHAQGFRGIIDADNTGGLATLFTRMVGEVARARWALAAGAEEDALTRARFDPATVRVLVVDDDDNHRAAAVALVTKTLVGSGIGPDHILQASDVSTAEHLIDESGPALALVITDFRLLGGRWGTEIALAAKTANPATAVAITSLSPELIGARLARDGATAEEVVDKFNLSKQLPTIVGQYVVDRLALAAGAEEAGYRDLTPGELQWVKKAYPNWVGRLDRLVAGRGVLWLSQRGFDPHGAFAALVARELVGADVAEVQIVSSEALRGTKASRKYPVDTPVTLVRLTRSYPPDQLHEHGIERLIVWYAWLLDGDHSFHDQHNVDVIDPATHRAVSFDHEEIINLPHPGHLPRVLESRQEMFWGEELGVEIRGMARRGELDWDALETTAQRVAAITPEQLRIVAQRLKDECRRECPIVNLIDLANVLEEDCITPLAALAPTVPQFLREDVFTAYALASTRDRLQRLLDAIGEYKILELPRLETPLTVQAVRAWENALHRYIDTHEGLEEDIGKFFEWYGGFSLKESLADALETATAGAEILKQARFDPATVRVLVVDDDDRNRARAIAMVADTLAGHGIGPSQILQASNVSDTGRLIDESGSALALVITDFGFGKSQYGTEIALAAKTANPATAVVVMSARSLAVVDERLLVENETTMDQFLSKRDLNRELPAIVQRYVVDRLTPAAGAEERMAQLPHGPAFLQEAVRVMRRAKINPNWGTVYLLRPGTQTYTTFLNFFIEELQGLPFHATVGHPIWARDDAERVVERLVEHLQPGSRWAGDTRPIADIFSGWTQVFKYEIYPEDGIDGMGYGLDLSAISKGSDVIPKAIILQRYFVTRKGGFQVLEHGSFELDLHESVLQIDLQERPVIHVHFGAAGAEEAEDPAVTRYFAARAAHQQASDTLRAHDVKYRDYHHAAWSARGLYLTNMPTDADARRLIQKAWDTGDAFDQARGPLAEMIADRITRRIPNPSDSEPFNPDLLGVQALIEAFTQHGSPEHWDDGDIEQMLEPIQNALLARLHEVDYLTQNFEQVLILLTRYQPSSLAFYRSPESTEPRATAIIGHRGMTAPAEHVDYYGVDVAGFAILSELLGDYFPDRAQRRFHITVSALHPTELGIGFEPAASRPHVKIVALAAGAEETALRQDAGVRFSSVHIYRTDHKGRVVIPQEWRPAIGAHGSLVLQRDSVEEDHHVVRVLLQSQYDRAVADFEASIADDQYELQQRKRTAFYRQFRTVASHTNPIHLDLQSRLTISRDEWTWVGISAGSPVRLSGAGNTFLIEAAPAEATPSAAEPSVVTMPRDEFRLQYGGRAPTDVDYARVRDVVVVTSDQHGNGGTPIHPIMLYVHGELAIDIALERRVVRVDVPGVRFVIQSLPLLSPVEYPAMLFHQTNHPLDRDDLRSLPRIELPAERDKALQLIDSYAPAALAAAAFEPRLLGHLAGLRVEARTFDDEAGNRVLVFFV